MSLSNKVRFLGDIRCSDPDFMVKFVDTLVREIKRTCSMHANRLSEECSSSIREYLMGCNLSYTEAGGFYILDVDNPKCEFIHHNIGKVAMDIINESSTEVDVDIESDKDIQERIKSTKEELAAVVAARDDLARQDKVLKFKEDRLRHSIQRDEARLTMKSLPNEKALEGDYIVAVNGCYKKSVYKVVDVFLDKYHAIWKYTCMNVAAKSKYDGHEYFIDRDILSVIKSKPLYKEKSSVMVDGMPATVQLVRYDIDSDAWKYKILVFGKTPSWEFEDRLQETK